MRYRYIMGGLALTAALALQGVGPGRALAAGNPFMLGLQPGAFPAGAFIIHEHVDRTAAAVDAEGFVGNPSTQGDFYKRLRFSGSLFESVRLPRFNGAPRQVWMLATLFPSAAVAAQALSGDAQFNQCDQSPPLSIPGRAVTCAYINAQGPESGMYVVAAVGRVEFIVVGFVHRASAAARYRAERDASFVALHEAVHIQHLTRLGRLGSGPSARPAR